MKGSVHLKVQQSVLAWSTSVWSFPLPASVATHTAIIDSPQADSTGGLISQVVHSHAHPNSNRQRNRPPSVPIVFVVPQKLNCESHSQAGLATALAKNEHLLNKFPTNHLGMAFTGSDGWARRHKQCVSPCFSSTMSSDR